ncbi:MAG: YdcF family protein [Halieaceae bacterium]|nr:YdcF family protein [Halieaceae bacterium]
MLSTLLKLSSLLVYPLSLCLLLGFLGMLVWRLGLRRTGATTVFGSLLWLYVCSTASFSYMLIGKLEENYPSRPMSEIPRADAIVLLGGALRGDSAMGILPDLNQYADRLVHAVALYKAGKADYILVTGGSAPGARSEARLMQDVLAVMGVPPSALILEEQSKNTHDNAVNSATILHKRGMQRILLVSSAFHMRRADTLFKRQGLDVIPAPTDYQQVLITSTLPAGIPGVKNLYRTTEALHEIVGYEVYRMRGWL